MKPPKHVSPRLAQLLERLAHAVPTCKPEDPQGMSALARDFEELQQALEREQGHALAGLAGVGACLVERLAADGLVGPLETMEVIGQALESVRQVLGLKEQPQDTPAIAPAQRRAPLALVDGRRIGELLVTLSMLKPSDVERALALQQQTGSLLGEALVELGIVGRSSVDAALRLQSSRRRRERAGEDPWALPGA